MSSAGPPAAAAPPAAPDPVAPAAAAKPSNAELKKRAKAEKAARRAQAKASTAAPPSTSAAASLPPAPAASQPPPSTAPQSAATRSGSRSLPTSAPPTTTTTTTTTTSPAASASSAPQDAIPEAFSHLSIARRPRPTQADKDVHPAIVALGQQMGAFALRHSISRLHATLLALEAVVDSYRTPHGASFSRHFTSHMLNPQIEYLSACRPMCFSMGNAVRWLKLQISKLGLDLPDADAKQRLQRAMEAFVRERILLADYVIARTAADMMAALPDSLSCASSAAVDEEEEEEEEAGEDDDSSNNNNNNKMTSNGSSRSCAASCPVILVYAHHPLVERALLQARADGQRFRVQVVDDASERSGLGHAKRLAAAGIPVAYSPHLGGALRSQLRQASIVLTAAEAMFSNGAMYARAGTCDLATAAADLRLRLVVLCETINFTDRVAIDALTYNEIDPDCASADGLRLLYDTTPARLISTVVTELGYTSAKSVPAIMRKLDEL